MAKKTKNIVKDENEDIQINDVTKSDERLDNVDKTLDNILNVDMNDSQENNVIIESEIDDDQQENVEQIDVDDNQNNEIMSDYTDETNVIDKPKNKTTWEQMFGYIWNGQI